MADNEFEHLLEIAASRFDSKQAFAKAIGITPGRLSRILASEHSLSVENCLKVAKLSGEPASRVLRLAGKEEIAQLIESLYGEAKPAISPRDRQLLDLWDKLRPNMREHFLTLIQELAERQQPTSKKKSKAS